MKARAFAAAWRIVPHLPEKLVRALFSAAFRLAARVNGPPVRTLRANLARFRPEPELAALTRAGMRSYGAYWAESFLLPRLVRGGIAGRVRVHGSQEALADMERGTVVLALGHCGNWDIAGAWVSANFHPVLTVAERLRPEELFEKYLAFRESLGMEVIAFEKGAGVFSQLVAAARRNPRVICLLADRDLSRSGIEVNFGGEKALFAAGPAALALELDCPLYTVGLVQRPLAGAGGKPVPGIDIHFAGPIVVDRTGPDAVRSLTQAWVDELDAFIRKHPESWHMLQPVFTADLDQARLARRAGGPPADG